MKPFEGLEEWLKWLDRLPGPLRGKVADEVRALRETVLQARTPRLLVTGRRGSGKSMLINAVLGREAAPRGAVRSTTGKAQWYDTGESSGRTELSILDTRGVGDRTRPSNATSPKALDELRSALSDNCPDAVLFLCKAKEVDSRINEDLADLSATLRFIQEKHRYEAPLIAIVSQVDELDPASLVTPPYDDARKQANIRESVELLEQALSAQGLKPIAALPLSSYFELGPAGEILNDRRWNVEKLVELLSEALPNDARLAMARAGRALAAKQSLARKIVKSSATIAAGIGATPIPIADLPVITGLQLIAVSAVAYLGGRELSKEGAREFLGALGLNVGAAFALREAARALVKFVFPGAGLAVSGAIAFAGTWAIGEAAIAYFLENAPIDEARRRFEEGRKSAP